MKKLLSKWIATIMVGVMIASSGGVGIARAEGISVQITEENLQTNTEKDDLETEGDLSVGDDETSWEEDGSVVEENNATEPEVVEEGGVNEENVGESLESTEVLEEMESGVSEEIEMALNYLYINEAEQQEGEQQSIVLSWGNENTQVNNISLTLENENGEQTVLEATKKSGELYLYENTFSQGIYHVSNVHVVTDESEKDFTAKELEIDAYFGVGKTPNESAKSSYIEMESVEEGEDSANTAASVETSVVSIGENGEETAEASIGAALEAQGVTARSGKARSARAKNVVVLDPGHDSKHAGAYGNGVREEVATLKIAKYCKEELEQYNGITVYMTREGVACPFPNSKNNIDDIKQRTAWAKTKGADVFVSFHLNSNDSSSPNGAEVYYPKTSSGGAALAQKIQGELVSLGLKNRGTKANETLAVINSSMKNGFPGVLIEHAFVSNSSDANNYLNSDAKLKKLGVADAKGIASYFGLGKGYWKKENGKQYYYINGQRITGEKYISGQWYYLNPEENGAMVTGIYKFPNKTVYYGTDGAMRYGEQLIDGHWYYFDTITGAMATGFHKFPNKTVYYDNDGKMHYGELILDGKKYYFDSITGAMKDKEGWIKEGDKTYYYESNKKVTGEKYISGKWYYFDSKKNGVMITGLYKFPDKTVYYGKDGAMRYGEQLINGHWYYFDTITGAMATGLHKFPKKTVYYGTDGAMRYGEQLIDGHWYYFDTITGAMATGFHKFPNKTVYYDNGGKMYYGELALNGKKYYFDLITGAMLTNGMFDGEYYGPDGVQRECYKILGKSNTSIDQMVRYYNEKSPIAYPSEKLGKGGAPDIRTMATIFYEEAAKENIKAEVVWAQTMKETGYFKFGGQVKIEQFNFAGIGAVDGGAAGASFPNVRIGVRAQIQHMKAYADASITKKTLSSPCVDPRFDFVNPKGSAPYVEWLGQKENPDGYGWATGKEYGIDIVGMIQILLNF